MKLLAPLILGSTSVYRAQLLQRLQVPFTVCRPDVDETPLRKEAPSDLATRLARAKCRAVSQQHPAAIVIGADQVANREGECVGKPGSREGAIADLAKSSGRTVIFHSAVCVKFGDAEYEFVNDTRCVFRELGETEIIGYIDAEAPLDCAGSIKSEGLGISLLESMDSNDPTGIIGLPLIELARVLRKFRVLA